MLTSTLQRQCVDNLSLHVIHIGFISDLFNRKRLVVQVERRKACYCQRAVFVSDLTIMQMNVFSPHFAGAEEFVEYSGDKAFSLLPIQTIAGSTTNLRNSFVKIIRSDSQMIGWLRKAFTDQF